MNTTLSMLSTGPLKRRTRVCTSLFAALRLGEGDDRVHGRNGGVVNADEELAGAQHEHARRRRSGRWCHVSRIERWRKNTASLEMAWGLPSRISEHGGRREWAARGRTEVLALLHLACPPCFHASVWHSLEPYSVVEQPPHLWTIFFASNLRHRRSWSVRAIAKFLVHTSTFSHVAAPPTVTACITTKCVAHERARACWRV
jgi:hypothetical protein